jgi:malate dehydrogenase (oxaloacetate-decarboxylating)(NADP+)
LASEGAPHVTDGDLGANGMGISVGKLPLDSPRAGNHPSICLPIVINVGAQNNQRQKNLVYIEFCQERRKGTEYDKLS